MIKSTSATNVNATKENSGGENMRSIQKSHTTNCLVEKKRGFKPSDRHDPTKKQFLTHLSQQIWQKQKESANVTKKIDLHKIFTPATDSEENLHKNRKLYASSAFYSPTLHPTVEDQVALARKISNSLSDISNQQSRGQSMYVNRKKRSVKWVHEGCGQDENKKITTQEEYDQEEKENDAHHHENVPLKFLMNPYGQMRDINSLRESINTETGLLSPDVSAEVVTALQARKGKGAELFAKRRKVSEKWVVDESNVGAQSPSGLPDCHQYEQQPKPCTSPSVLPAYTDAAKHRVQLNLHQEQLLEKYAKPSLKVVQTPWEAALNSGSASAAFVEEQKLSPYIAPTLTPSPTPRTFDARQGEMLHQSASTILDSYRKTYSTDDYQRYATHAGTQQQVQHERQQYTGTNSQRELAYKPSIPQGWRAPSMSLPKVEFKEQKQTSKSHIRTTSEIDNSCKEFNTVDETELISFLPNNDVPIGVSNCKMTNSQIPKHISHREAHEFVNHFVKSPELRLSPIPAQVIYNNAVQELNVKQMKEQNKLESKSLSIDICNDQIKNVKETEEKINVRKQLQEYEDLLRQYAKQLEKEKLLQKKREAAKLKALQQNSKKSTAKNRSNNKINSTPSDSSVQSGEKQIFEQQTEEKYVKVPVKELITNFEQQCLNEERLNMPSPLASSSTLKETIIVEADEQIDSDDIAKNFNEDLYMPKEIPVQSYAPPPVAAVSAAVSPYSSNAAYEKNQFSIYKPLNASPVMTYSLPETTQSMTKAHGGSITFPVSKPYQQGFSSAYNSQAPRQQYLPPQSYQKVPQATSQNISQVNFNPSPLPYDKLAKFENQPEDESRYITSPSRTPNRKVCNTSSAPFAGSYNRPYTPSSDRHYHNDTPRTSPRPHSSTQQYSGYNTPNLTPLSVTSNQILNAPSYNTSARGWGCSVGSSVFYQYPQSLMSASKPQIVNAASIPYTDF